MSELDLVHLKIKDEEITEEIGDVDMNTIERVYLRQNLLTLEKDLPDFPNLVELDLYDNKIESDNVINLARFTRLEILDISFNLLRFIHSCLQKLPLKQLYLIQNKLSVIDNLDIPSLEVLELGGNRIRQIDNLNALSNLKQLWLGKNKIEKLENLDNLQSLELLSIQANRLTSMDGLSNLHNLKELYLSHNGITEISGLESLTNLETLDVSNNQLKTITNVSHLTKLQELWVNSNQIDNLEDVEQELKGIESLHTIYLEHNPIQRTLDTSYRRKLKLLLPQLKQIDATLTN
ncbi:hypothetical protein E3P99_00321 [Wallemia hederae]|uniref:Protein phosphatase 1 regulatory subunit 7 n=1 Tax=Wallemia hederae TaxID=1540922 RepID=A0A4T0FY16_9BASI|nr:hypothetical protein E3P99_00321 [Wallemia hederae]